MKFRIVNLDFFQNIAQIANKSRCSLLAIIRKKEAAARWGRCLFVCRVSEYYHSGYVGINFQFLTVGAKE